MTSYNYSIHRHNLNIVTSFDVILFPLVADEDHPIVRAGDFTEKLALLRANDDEALEDEYAVSSTN